VKTEHPARLARQPIQGKRKGSAMKFPSWAHHALVEYWKQTDGVFRETVELFKTRPPEDSEKFARHNNYASWPCMREITKETQDCLERLLTNQEAGMAWEWIASGPKGSDLIPEVWWRISRALQDWIQSPKMTEAEYISDFNEMSELAGKLARKLLKHSSEYQLIFSPAALIPEDYRERIEPSLHPNLVASYKEINMAPIMAINGVLPPMYALMESISTAAKNCEPPKNRPRKMRGASALRNIIIEKLSIFLLGNEVKFSTTNMARLLSVALDDDSITGADIRMYAQNQDWWEWAKDSTN